MVLAVILSVGRNTMVATECMVERPEAMQTMPLGFRTRAISPKHRKKSSLKPPVPKGLPGPRVLPARA